MQYLDAGKLEEIDTKRFLDTRPFPFINPAGLLTTEGYRELVEHVPEVDVMTPSFGRKRSHGQDPHDRYLLEYSPRLNTVHESWHRFAEELHGPEYTAFLQRLYQRKSIHLNMHWHYAPSGCSVSPHCDASHKLGSHIFYLNRIDEWDPAWGGGTLILDDGGRFHPDSAPSFEDFDACIESECVGNYSTLFARRNRSWHGVKKIRCPDDQLRKVFIVVINHPLMYAGRQALKWLKLKK